MVKRLMPFAAKSSGRRRFEKEREVLWVDLHFHSTCSDGSLAPEEIAPMLRGRDLQLFALTDHDSIAGYATIQKAVPEIPSLCSLELSCREAGRSVHVLLYAIPESSRSSLQGELDAIREGRVQRIFRICEALAKKGIELDPDEILAAVGSSTPGRPHVAKALVDRGYCPSQQQAFTRYLRDGAIGDIPSSKLSLADGLALGRAHGAKMSLAHPHVYQRPALVAEFLRDYRHEGLEALEVFYSTYSQSQRQRWMEMAQDLGCVATGGSDFHGEQRPEVAQLGVAMPKSRAEQMFQWLGIGGSG